MRSKKPILPNKDDAAWQKKVEKKIKDEKLGLNHSKGLERFEKTIKQALKKKA